MTFIHKPIATQQCTRCFGTWGIGQFHKRGTVSRGENVYILREKVCIGCKQNDRDADKSNDPFVSKAKSTIAFHAKRLGLSVEVFRRYYGWDLARVAYKMRHDYTNTCDYCRRLYSAMGNGFADITLDIIDRSRPPYFDSNVKPCCRTCNTEKSTMTPDEWAERLIFWREYEVWQRNPEFGHLPGQQRLF
jgi:hypothetical protein